ncbi:transglycosylase SLT domain-containing protein [Duganella radicis]|uniref:Transglycosylase SLT domain-containing protein n=2 Tax=Duganella radicis TaxID=551988 RepID=A0A6L6PSA2_9BURK|nr:transglycosylase SLT domain-containing protein [Duganella radicis]
MPPPHTAIRPAIAARARRWLLGAVALLACGGASACWEEAAARYGVNPYLLYAIAKTESQLNPAAINRNNQDGSYDIGLMQINSHWLPTLRKYGIAEEQLWDACVNIQVGAWVLAQNMRRMGNSWEAVGAYNARNPERRLKYALKVYRNLPPQVLDEQR